MPQKTPKHIDFKTGQFKSNGTDYFLYQGKMGYERSKRFEQMIPEILIGSTFQDHVGELFKVRNMYRDATTDGHRYDAYQLLANICNKAREFLSQDHATSRDVILEFCALFIVTENEDCTTINNIHFQKKINDWKTDMVMDDFFFYAQTLLRSSTRILDLSSDPPKEKQAS